MHKVVFSPLANTDLTDIGDYIASDLQNPASALRLILKIKKVVGALEQFPEMGTMLDANNASVPFFSATKWMQMTNNCGCACYTATVISILTLHGWRYPAVDLRLNTGIVTLGDHSLVEQCLIVIVKPKLFDDAFLLLFGDGFSVFSHSQNLRGKHMAIIDRALLFYDSLSVTPFRLQRDELGTVPAPQLGCAPAAPWPAHSRFGVLPLSFSMVLHLASTASFSFSLFSFSFSADAAKTAGADLY